MRKRALFVLSLPLFFFFFTKGSKKSPDQEAPTLPAPTLSKTLSYVQDEYVERDSLDAKKLLQSSLQRLEAGISPFIARNLEDRLTIRYADKKATLEIPQPLQVSHLGGILEKTLGFLEKHYDGRLDRQEREHLATGGLVSALDSHSNFLPPQIYKEFRIGTRGNFGGLGIVIGLREGDLTVISPLEDTPAWKAGIRAKDRIVAINDEPTLNMSLTEAVEKLRGPVRSAVNIVVRRSGVASPLSFNLHRALINVRSVAGRLLEGNEIALVKIKTFQEDTLKDFSRLMGELRIKNPNLRGVILDLRNNPGGLLDQAIELADRFLIQGEIVKTVGPGSTEVRRANPGQPEEFLPLVVLVNEGSASASEIIAGTLQQNDRALILGNLTFGKGSVQTVFELKDGSALKLTIAKYLTAGDREVQSVGVPPDVELIHVSTDKEHMNLFEDATTREGELKKTHVASTVPQISYLTPELKPEEAEEESYRFPLKEDFPIRLARKVLESPESRLLKRTSMMTALPKLVREGAKTEEDTLEDVLGQMGIDWSIGPKTGGRAQVAHRVMLKDAAGRRKEALYPGEKIILEIEVENRGSIPLYRFAAVTESDDSLFNNLEFPFGRLDPGRKRAWKTTLSVPDFALPRSHPFALNFHEAHGHIPGAQKVELLVQERQAPSFSYSYMLFDGGRKGTFGNQNGRIEAGESIGVLVNVRNEGPAPSSDPVVNLKNLGGREIFLEQGRIKLQPIPVGKEAEAWLSFRVPQDLSTEAEKISLELSIRDLKAGEELADRMSFGIGDLDISPSPLTWHTPPRLKLEKRSLKNPGANYLIKGAVSDDEEVRHLIVFVGDSKAIYLSPPEKGVRQFPFEAKVRLKSGTNLITMVAQDNRELTTRHQWIVWRP